MTKRVVFTFDERSYHELHLLKTIGGFPSLAEALRVSLMIRRGLQSQAAQGFTEVVVRQPGTGLERVMVL